MNDERLATLELSVGRLLRLVDTSRDPVAAYLVSQNASASQETHLFELMSTVEEAARSGQTVDAVLFQRQIESIFPPTGYVPNVSWDRLHGYPPAIRAVEAFEAAGMFKGAVDALRLSDWFLRSRGDAQ